MQQIIIDLEFTGLDNTFIKDNEIIQVKAANVKTGKYFCQNYGSDKEITAHPFMAHKVKKYDLPKFSSEDCLAKINQLLDPEDEDKIKQFYGWGIDLDKKMLEKHGINIPIIDIREQLQLTEFEEALATQGRSLEVAYYIATGKIPELKNHDGIEELKLIVELFEIAESLPKKDYLTIMPNGHCAGMPITEYVMNYRRAADGYRFNNNDLLAKSLNNQIEINEWGQYDENDVC